MYGGHQWQKEQFINGGNRVSIYKIDQIPQ